MRELLRNIKNKSRHQNAIWRYGFNFSPTLQYKFRDSSKLDSESQRIVDDLNRNGIVVSSVSDCLGEVGLFKDLDTEVRNILGKRNAELCDLKKSANDTESIGAKTFNVQILGPVVDFQPESVFARFALQETFLNIANTYFEMMTKLRYFDVWYTFATNSEARESQLWHFDREDYFILKLFVYLDEVDEGSGPFTYAPQTHKKGLLKNSQPEFFDENGVRRSTDEQMNAIVSSDRWIRALGQKGTIVFADTHGFHKGGEARDRDRLMFTAMFTSPASDSERLLRISKEDDLTVFSDLQRSALEF